ncbi:MAG: hypothetical protein ACYTHJ_18335 [Planctomycetota bacterium]
MAVAESPECGEVSITKPAQPGVYWLVVLPFGSTDLSSCGAKYTATLSSSEFCPGDSDRDTDVDLVDHRDFVDCLSGPGEVTGSECAAFDSNADVDVDLQDYGRMQMIFTGSW